MKFQENSFTKLCSFYVSDWHLVTMLLPYINKKIEEETKIATILEKDITQNVDILLKKLKLKTNDQIRNIDWTRTNGTKYLNIKKVMEENQNQVIIISGTKEFIENTNENIKKYIQKNALEINRKITLVNCYEIIEFNENISEILDKHDKILNTSGEKEITEIFEDYERKTKIS